MARRRRRRRRFARKIVWLVILVVAALCFRYRGFILDMFCSKPPGIVIHHSASPPYVNGRPIDAKALDTMHAHRGFGTWYKGKLYHIGYHFVVLPDGTVQTGRPIGCRGAHTHGKTEYNTYIGICVVGDFCSWDNKHGEKGPVRPSGAQMDALAALCSRLMKQYNIGLSHVKRHTDLNQTACPGDRFPFGRFLARLKRQANQ